LVISDNRKGQAWYVTEAGYRIRSLENVPETCLYNVRQAFASPDDKYLAVVSVGEGHPVLEIFPLDQVLNPRDDEEDYFVEPLLAIDPFPGWVWIAGWQAPTVLRISSDMPLQRLDRSKRRVRDGVLYLEDENSYLWDVGIDAIERK